MLVFMIKNRKKKLIQTHTPTLHQVGKKCKNGLKAAIEHISSRYEDNLKSDSNKRVAQPWKQKSHVLIRIMKQKYFENCLDFVYFRLRKFEWYIIELKSTELTKMETDNMNITPPLW